MVKVILNIDKKYFFGLLFFGLMLVGIAGVVAYNAAGTGGNPAAFGHSVDEIDWTKAISGNVSAGGFCINGNCITSWSGVGGGGDSSQWIISGQNIYYNNNGSVGIGTASPSAKLTVASGDVQIVTQGSGLILSDIDGNGTGCHRVIVNTAGALATQLVDCSTGIFIPVYAWQMSSWGNCSVGCRGGTQTRSMWCQRSDGLTVDDSFCSGTKPAASESCNTQDCSWNYCATEGGNCGFSGTRYIMYGESGGYCYAIRSGGDGCSNSLCGDPKLWVRKKCWYSSESW